MFLSGYQARQWELYHTNYSFAIDILICLQRKEYDMTKIINWLLQPTSDGATYLQVIILAPLLCVLIYGIYFAVSDIWNDIKEEEDNGENDN